MTCLSCVAGYALACALLELDGLRVGQWMVSRPIVLGPLLGWWLGDAALGALLGAAAEILTLDSLPMGALVPVNGTVAVAAAVWVGAAQGVPGLAFAGGLALGGCFRVAEIWLRARAGGLNAALDAEADAAGTAAWALARATLAHGALCWAMLGLGIRVLEALAGRVKALEAATGFETALGLVPVLGLMAFLSALRPRT